MNEEGLIKIYFCPGQSFKSSNVREELELNQDYRVTRIQCQSFCRNEGQCKTGNYLIMNYKQKNVMIKGQNEKELSDKVRLYIKIQEDEKSLFENLKSNK